MKEFVLLFRVKAMGDFQPTPDQMQERIDWLANLVAEDKLVDKGNTLLPIPGSSATIGADGSVSAGPYTDAAGFVSGYMVVHCQSIEEAIELAKANPIFKIGGTIEVREVLKRH